MSSSTDALVPAVATLPEVIVEDNWRWEPGEIKVVPLGRPATTDDLSRTRLLSERIEPAG
jgi:hypothetical protein